MTALLDDLISTEAGRLSLEMQAAAKSKAAGRISGEDALAQMAQLDKMMEETLTSMLKQKGLKEGTPEFEKAMALEVKKHGLSETPPVPVAVAGAPSEEAQPAKSYTIKDIDNLIGLKEVKAQAKEFIRLAQANAKELAALEKAVARGETQYEEDLKTLREEVDKRHMIFNGNPGTGKTSVALMMAGTLHAGGVLPRNHVVISTPGQLKGDVVGAAEKNVRAKLDELHGAVWIIDEAHALANDVLSRNALAELVSALTNPQYADVTIILAGYEDKIEKMLMSIDPGLPSRFQHRLQFEDYSPEELFDIVSLKMKGQRVKFSDKAKKSFCSTIKQIIDSVDERGIEGFGNGRVAENFARKLIAQIRLARLAEEEAGSTNSWEKQFIITPEMVEDVFFGSRGIVAADAVLTMARMPKGDFDAQKIKNEMEKLNLGFS
jgi:stage V sporulation protein K